VAHSYDHADDHVSVDGTTMRLLARAAVCGALLASAAAFVAGPATAAPPAPVSGTVFGDANSNGTPDAGEGLTAFPISFDLQSASGTTTAVTSTAGGAFQTSLAPGTYYVSGSGGGWHLIGRSVTVPAVGLHLDLRAVHPLGKVLTASLHFTLHTYAPGDVVHLVVTVANTGSSLLRGIGAECDHVGDADELANNSPGWDALELGADGLTLPAHSARTVDVTDHVPAGAQRAGQVVAACDFGYNGVDSGYRPSASDRATVPGQSGAVAGVVSESTSLTPGLAGVQVVLVNERTCPTIRKTATTDSRGRFRFSDVPAGPNYLLYFAPPSGWRILHDNPTRAFVFGHDTVNLVIQAQRGTARVPTPPATCASPTTRPSTSPSGSSSDVPLANTGSASGAALDLALLLLMAGAGLLLVSRTRRRSH
jgi:hypothetical protein